MRDLLRLAARLRRDPADPATALSHRLRAGLFVAALIFLVSHLG